MPDVFPTIIIVDDWPQNSRTLEQILKPLGFRLRCYGTLEEAVATIKTRSPSLLLLDLKLAQDYCQSHAGFRDSIEAIPTIFTGKFTTPNCRQEVYRLGGVDYVFAPYISKEVINKVRIQLNTQLSRHTENELLDLQKRTQLMLTIATVSNQAPDPRESIRRTVEVICLHTGWPVGHVYFTSSDGKQLVPSSIWSLPNQDTFESFVKATQFFGTLNYGDDLPGRVLSTGKPVWISDIALDQQFKRKNASGHMKVRAGFAFPVILDGELLAVLEFFSPKPQSLDPAIMKLLLDIGQQLGFAIARKQAESGLMDRQQKLTRVLDQIRELNIELEQRVNERTGELSRTNNELQALNVAKNRFLSTMSHEIRTPMNGVLGMVQLLMDTPLNNTQRRYIDTIHRSGDSLLTVLNDILDYSKIEAGKLEIESIEFDLEQLVDECAAVFATKSTYSSIELLADTKPGTPSQLRSDPNRIRQIILNLLSNAFKFTQEGQIRLHVKAIPSKSRLGSEDLLFVIKDAGIGMTQKQLDRLFVPFSQADSSTARRFGGSGLGLMICKQLAELLQGEIGVNSKPNQGSTFWFSIPLQTCIGTSLEPAAATHSSFDKKRLLLVDENREYGQMIADHTAHWGMLCEYTDTFEAAWQCIEREPQPYDIVLFSSTSNMHTGLEFAKSLRASSVQNHDATHLIMLTSGQRDIDALPLAESGISAALEKPHGMGQLRNCLLEVIEGRQNEAQTLTKTDIPSLEQLNVLVAEDNDVNRLVIKHMLFKYSINPVMVTNGEEALAHYNKTLTSTCLKTRDIDLILMDCEMPELNGFDATKRIRQVEKDCNLKPVPIVALTAHAMDKHKTQALSCGMDSYLTKPLNIKQLEHILMRHSHSNVQRH